MHGLINRSFQSFIQETYGQDAWELVIQAAGLEFSSFEAMLTYADELTDQVIEAGVTVLGRSVMNGSPRCAACCALPG